MARSQIIEGTGEELRRRLKQSPRDYFRLVPLPALPKSEKRSKHDRPSALGKYAFVPGGSEAFAIEKQTEIEREDSSGQ